MTESNTNITILNDNGQNSSGILPYEPEPWDRQIDESWKDFELFTRYRDALPSDRRWTKIAKIFGMVAGSVKRIAITNKWEERLTLYNQFLDREKQAMAVIEREKMYERQIALSMKMQGIVNDAIDQIDPETLSPTDVTRWADLSTKIELRARGEPTENIKEQKNINIQQTNTAVGIILDEAAAKMACDLLERVSKRG